jgi:hypothetical protein
MAALASLIPHQILGKFPEAVASGFISGILNRWMFADLRTRRWPWCCRHPASGAEISDHYQFDAFGV